jgi:hypothetical protein
MSSDLIGGYLTFYLNQPIKWADFRLDALLADTMLTKLNTTGPKSLNTKYIIFYAKKDVQNGGDVGMCYITELKKKYSFQKY